MVIGVLGQVNIKSQLLLDGKIILKMMQEQKLKFTLIFLMVIQSCTMLMSQNKFLNINDFSLAYQENPDLKYLEQRFDLLKILMLDSTKANIFVSYDPELEQLSKQYTEGMTLNKATVGFVSHVNDIREVFDEPERILNCLFGSDSESRYKIDHPIYIKGNDALMEISSPTTSDLYYLRYYQGVTQINWLGGTIQ